MLVWGQSHSLGTHEKRMSDHPLTWISASELTTLYARKVLSPVDVVDAMVERAEKLQPSLNAFVLIDRDGARAAATARMPLTRRRPSRTHPSSTDSRLPALSSSARRRPPSSAGRP